MTELSQSVQSYSYYPEKCLKEQKDNQSMFVCLSYYLIETLIRLKSSQALNELFYHNLNRVIESASNYIPHLDLNPSILLNLQQIAAEIFNEPSPSISFGYLRYYFSFINPECLITINYGMRLIIVYLLKDYPEIQISIINSKSFDWYKSIEVFVEAFKIQVALIQDQENIVFYSSQDSYFINVFLYKENEAFSVLCIDDFFNLFELDELFEKDLFEVPALYLDIDLDIFTTKLPPQSHLDLESEPKKIVGGINLDIISDNILPLQYNSDLEAETNKVVEEYKDKEEVNTESCLRNTRRKRVTRYKCKKSEFLSCMDMIKKHFKLDEINGQDLINAFISDNTIEFISIKNFIKLLDMVIPDKLYNIENLKKLSKQMHKIFEISRLTISERDEIFLAATQLKTCLISKTSCIKTIELLLKCLVLKKRAFNTVLKNESNRFK